MHEMAAKLGVHTEGGDLSISVASIVGRIGRRSDDNHALGSAVGGSVGGDGLTRDTVGRGEKTAAELDKEVRIP